MKQFKNLTYKEILQAIEENEYLGTILRLLECHDNTCNRDKLKKFIEENNIDCSHIRTKTTRTDYEKNPKRCKYCGEIIPYDKRQNDFCNHSCSASYNNLNVCRNGESLPKHSYCLNCGREITRGTSYCNNTCYAKHLEQDKITKWLNGELDGIRAKDDIATYVRNYLFELHNNSCLLCGWNKVNPYTGRVPLLIHHIDGDCMNNRPENLQLLCPNCHTLTENFGSRNKNCTRIDKRVR